jgi:iron(III) transport system substrate-binding protein
MKRMTRSEFLRTTAIGLGAMLAFGGSVHLALADELEDAAKAEGGKVSFYSNIADVQPLFDEVLKAKYPWLTVEVFGGSPGDVRGKFLTEIQAGLPAADVVVATLADIKPYRAANAIAKVDLPNDKAMPPALAAVAPELHPLWQTLYVMPYSTDAGITPPKDLYELADPKWKGHIAFDRPSNAGATAAVLASRKQLWGEEKWNTWLDGLKANDISIKPSANNTYAAILQGEQQVGIGGLQDVLNQKQGAPVAANFYDDVVANQNFGVISRIAPHPAAAAFFVNWLMSEEGQAVFAKASRIPARVIDSPMSINNLVPKDVKVLTVAEMPDWIANTSDYLAKFKTLWPE